MLTESEREWLKERVLLPCYSCKYCTGYHNQSCNAFEPLSSCWNRLCENFDFEYFDKEVFLDALEFSERVVANLAEMAQYNIKFGCEACPAYIDDAVPCKPYCAALLLKTAQLAVEEEMDGTD